jgi:uncharacterized repeat protein (TIGR01451 family)
MTKNKVQFQLVLWIFFLVTIAILFIYVKVLEAAIEPSWIKLRATGPPVHGAAYAYDTERNRAVMFGGESIKGINANTWEWDGDKWTQVSSSGPARRVNAAMAYDASRREIILFGGWVTPDNYYGDTWAWDGSNWTLKATSGPGPRANCAIAYDSKRQRIVLFGGSYYQRIYGDTWEWDGNKWILRSTTGPTPRIFSRMVYDEARGKVVLFGGQTQYPGILLNDTWEWDGTSWQQVASNGPSGRAGHMMAYDPLRKVIVLFGGGGWGIFDKLGDTWEWDGSNWFKILASGPNARDHAAIFYDHNRSRVILFGGNGYGVPLEPAPEFYNDTWLLDIPEPGIETSFSESHVSEVLLAKKAVLNNVTVSGDFISNLNFTEFELVTITTGPFAGKGFSKGKWETKLEGILYKGEWQGVIFNKPTERKIYLKGAISGEISATVEGYLTESIPESGIYDQYQATWKIGRLGDTTTSAIIKLNGSLVYQSSSEFPGTELYILQANFKGTISGHYSGSFLNTILTHIRVADESNPYHGQGFSIISYVSDYGSGEGWTYDKLTSPGLLKLIGLFSNPMFGIVSATLDESKLPRNLFIRVLRIDLGLPPMADLEVKIWGPTRVSPGQTVNYIIEYRNDGVKAAENVIVVAQLPYAEYESATQNGIYRLDRHEVFWRLDTLKPKAFGYLSVRITYPWGLPEDSFPLIRASIKSTNSRRLPELLFDFNLEEYFNYEPLIATESRPLSPEEIYALLNDDPKLSDLYQYAIELGFDFKGIAVEIVLSDGSAFISLFMNSSTNEEVLLLTKKEETAFLEEYTENEISFFDREGGITYNIDTDSFEEWGKWSEKSSCSPAQCIFNCIFGKKLPKWLVKIVFKKIRMILKWKTCLMCANGDLDACVQCAAKIKKIPLVSEGIDVKKCVTGCMKDPNKHCCDPRKSGSIECSVDKEGYLSSMKVECIGGLWTLGLKTRCVASCMNLLGGRQLLETCAVIPTCYEGLSSDPTAGCGCIDSYQAIPLHKSRVTVARDPNIKYGPEGSVLPGQKLDYKVEYENEGEGIAFGVYFTDTLDEDLDDSTLEIGPVISTVDGSVIAPPGTYDPATRTITWFVGEVGPGEGGYAEFSVNVREDAPDETEIINFATVYFPSVPEETRTNGIVSIVRLYPPPVAEANGPYEGRVGTPLTLDASGSFDPDGEIVSYEWDWNNDGIYDETTTSASITHIWNEPYSGTIRLRVTDNDGQTDVDTTFVEIKKVIILGDLDGDGDVDRDDLNFLLRFRNQPATACPQCDIDEDGIITVLDARKLVLLCTRPRCATEWVE